MLSIDYTTIALSILDNSPYFKKLTSTPDITEISKQVLQKNEELFSPPRELFELNGKRVILTNAVREAVKVNAKRLFTILALTLLASVALVIAVASAIFATLPTAAFFACSTLFLGLVVNYQASMIIKKIEEPALDLLSAFKKSINWATEFAKRHDLNTLNPECKAAFEESAERVELLRKNLSSAIFIEELEAVYKEQAFVLSKNQRDEMEPSARQP